MTVTVGVRIGAKKQICDDTAIVNGEIINDALFECESDEIRVIGVADGVGGNSGGKEASSFIARQLLKLECQKGVHYLREQFVHMNDDLIEHAIAI